MPMALSRSRLAIHRQASSQVDGMVVRLRLATHADRICPSPVVCLQTRTAAFCLGSSKRERKRVCGDLEEPPLFCRNLEHYRVILGMQRSSECWVAKGQSTIAYFVSMHLIIPWIKPCFKGIVPPCNLDGSAGCGIDAVIEHHVLVFRRPCMPSVSCRVPAPVGRILLHASCMVEQFPPCPQCFRCSVLLDATKDNDCSSSLSQTNKKLVD
jgi:hypothetical protein